MAMELENRCPVCLDIWEEPSYVLPCLHQFCLPCIMRWVKSKPECPLCKRRVHSILHSVRADNDFQELAIAPPAVHQPSAMLPGPIAPVEAYVWAFIFRVYPTVLQRLMPWLHQELGQLFDDDLEAAAAQSLILSSLRCYGLDEEALIHMLRIALGRRTRSFVRWLVNTVVHWCSGEARHQMGLEDVHVVEEREGSPLAAPSPTASLGGSFAPSIDHHRDRGGRPSAPVPTHGEQEETQEDQEEAVAGPSTHSQSSLGLPRRGLKRRAVETEGTSQPHKKPPHCQ